METEIFFVFASSTGKIFRHGAQSEKDEQQELDAREAKRRHARKKHRREAENEGIDY